MKKKIPNSFNNSIDSVESKQVQTIFFELKCAIVYFIEISHNATFLVPVFVSYNVPSPFQHAVTYIIFQLPCRCTFHRLQFKELHD